MSVSARLVDRLRAVISIARRRRAETLFYGAALVLRIFAVVVYTPTVAQWIDGPRFARIVPWDGVFSDYWTPAGYPAFLAVARAVWDNLAFTIVLQHVAGVATAALLAATAERLGVRRPWNLAAGALVAFGGDYLLLEHLLMTEAIFLFALALAVYFAVRSLTDDRLRWAVLASVSFASAGLIRSNAVLALFVLPALLLLKRGLSGRTRALTTSAALVPGVATLGAYLAVASAVGPYAGLSDMSGWHLYSRVGTFADCSSLDIVADEPRLSALCLPEPPEMRPGPYFFEWSPDSPARQLWGVDPSKDDTLRDFALEVIRNQPMDYLQAVGTDMVRVFAPSFRPRAGAGQSLDVFTFGYRDESVESVLEENYGFEYSGTNVVLRRGAGLLPPYQEATRLPGALLAAAIVLAALGALSRRPPARPGVALVLGVGLILVIGPILVFTWDYRYVLPATPFVVLAGISGLNALVSNRAHDEREGQPVEPMLVS